MLAYPDNSALLPIMPFDHPAALHGRTHEYQVE